MTSHLGTIVTIAVAVTGFGVATPPSTPGVAARPFCSIVPPSTLAIVRVDRDTMLAVPPIGSGLLSYPDVRAGAADSVFAMPGTPMPGARVHLLRLDAATRAALAEGGIRDSQPVAYLRAAPYRSDCHTIRWTDTTAFVVRGEVGYVRASLAGRDQWIGGVPLMIVMQPWNYPYPRRRSLAYPTSSDATLTSAEAYFALDSITESMNQRAATPELRADADSARREAVLTWARANVADAELEPARSFVHRAVLDADFIRAARKPSRLRGSYRVSVTSAAQSRSFFFRTEDRPASPWTGTGTASKATVGALLASPYVGGVRLTAYAAPASAQLTTSIPDRRVNRAIVWLASADRPTAPDNDARHTLPAILELSLASAPESLWDALEAFAPPVDARYSSLLADWPRSERQPRLPLTLRLDGRGGVRVDTTLTAGGRTIRVVLERLDTISVVRPRY